jgi:hypothetical protein
MANQNKNVKMATVLECNEFELNKRDNSKRGKKWGCWYGKPTPSKLSIVM